MNTMKQQFTSAATSINSTRLPAVYGKLPPVRPAILLDYGCGRYTDHIRAALPGTYYLPYDAFNQPPAVNAATLAAVDEYHYNRVPVSVVCSNVLNVIMEDAIVDSIAANIRAIIRDGGTAYITVYEGDRTGQGKQTGPDQYQRNQPLRDYLRFFPGAEIRRGMIVAKGGAV